MICTAEMVTGTGRVAGRRVWKQEDRSGQGKEHRKFCFVRPSVIQVLGELVVKDGQIQIIS